MRIQDFISSLSFLLIVNLANAASGDVTMVNSHNGTQLTWYGGYAEDTEFPDETKEYQQILMDFTLGCSTGGCSHWDYTVQVQVGDFTGEYDTVFAGYDTVFFNPIYLDTLYEARPIYEWYELGRMITPYGNYMDYAWNSNKHGFDETWEKTWTYDVTMMEPLLHGDRPVRVHFSGWPQSGRGFSARVDFRYIEGVPSKRVTNIQKVYNGGSYNNSAQFETDVVPAKSVSIDAPYADLRMIITGHGQDGEFTPVSYRVNADGNQIGEKLLWRGDCSENPLSPQGGTWIYNRANWCPGDDVEEHWFEMSDYVQNGTLDIDVDFDNYNPSNGASYTISGYIFEYRKVQRLYDVTVDKIVTPSVESEAKNITSSTNSTSVFDRYSTTICTNPVVRIKNLGNKDLTYCQIEYGVIGGSPFYFEWEGNLQYGATEDVPLPLIDWSGLDTSNPEFYAEVSYPNQLVDQFPHNNRMESAFMLPNVFDNGDLSFNLRANNKPQENSYFLFSSDGDTLLAESSFSANATNLKDVTLQDGCYKLLVYDFDTYFFSNNDFGGDGLGYWVNTQNNLETAGYFEIRQTGGGRLLYFDPDFGHKIHYEFMVGQKLHEQSNPPQPNAEPDHATVEEVTIDGVNYYHMPDSGLYFTEVGVGESPEEALSIKEDSEAAAIVNVFPNPNNGLMQININYKGLGYAQMRVLNVVGKLIDTERVPLNTNVQYNLGSQASGIYFLQFEIEGEVVTRKVSVY